MKETFIKILIGIACLWGGFQIAERGDRYISQDKLDAQQHFCENAVTTKGFLNEQYKEITKTKRRSSSKKVSYEFTYDFTVNHTGYQATHPSKDTLVDLITDVWYDKTNPEKNDTKDPCVQYEYYKTEKVVGTGIFHYLGGGFLMLMGFGLTVGTIREKVRNLFKKNKQP